MEQKRRIQDIVVKPNKTSGKEDYSPIEIKPVKKEAVKNIDTVDKKEIKQPEVKKKPVVKKTSPEPVSSFAKKKLDRKTSGRRMSAGSPSLGGLNSGDSGANLSVWGLVIISIIALFIVVLNMNASTLISVKTKRVSVPIDSVITAYAEPVGTQLGYDSVIIEANLLTNPSDIPLVLVEEKASGVITVYNEFSQSSQRLIEETRFESSDGKIYKTGKGVVTNVPGYKMEGSNKIAGSVEVTVYAENVGPEYNKEFADFSIPGFKGSPKYEKFYARSLGSISGGKTGFDIAIDGAGSGDQSLDIKGQIINSARNQIADRVPDDFIVFDSMFFIEDYLENQRVGDKLQISSKVKGLLFNKNDLSFVLAKDFFDVFPENVLPVLVNLSQMTVTVYQTNFDKGEIQLMISGQADFDWLLDENAFSLKILGMNKKAVKDFFFENNAIEDVKIKNKPFWKKSISNKIEKISYKKSLVID